METETFQKKTQLQIDEEVERGGETTFVTHSSTTDDDGQVQQY